MEMNEVRFYGIGEANGDFSNFAPWPIRYKGKTWPTSEHCFQAMKFDGAYREKIRKAGSPQAAADLGRSRKAKIRRRWDQIKDSLMYEIVLAKFKQHPELAEQLMETGTAKIIEHTANDFYWGDGGDGTGKNRLGKILMKVRAALAKSL